MRPPRPDLRADLLAAAVALAVAIAYTAQVWRWGRALDVRYPLGSDGPMWFDTARLLSEGRPVGLPPLLPLLLAKSSGGPPLVDAGLALNAVLVGLVLVSVALGAGLGAPARLPRWVAVVGAPLAVLTTADPAAYAWAIHPEVLITALLAGGGALAALVVRHPRPWTAALLGLCSGLAMCSKAHGLVLVLTTPILVGATGGPGRWGRLGGWALGVAPAVALSLCGDGVFTKALEMARESLGWAAPAPTGLDVLPIEMTEDQRRLVREGALLRVTAGQILTASRAWWPAYGAGLVGAVALAWRRQWGLLAALSLPLLTLAPAVFVWTEPRHYLVVAPSMVTLAVAGAAQLAGPAGARGALGLAAALGVAVAATAPGAGARLGAVHQSIVTEQATAGDDYDAVLWVLAHLDPTDRLIVRADPRVLGKTPFLPVGPGEALPDGTAVYQVVEGAAPGGEWEPVERFGRLGIFRQRAGIR